MQEDQDITTIPAMIDEVRKGKMARRSFMKRLSTMGISAVGIAIIAAEATRAKYPTLPPEVQTQEDAATHLRLHDQHITHQSQGRLDKLHEDYAEDAIVEDSMYAAPLIGRQAIIAHKSLGLAATAHMQIKVTNRVVKASQVTIEWIATGTHTGELFGLPASNRVFTLQGVTVTIRRNGKIVRESLYYNPDDLRAQLAAM